MRLLAHRVDKNPARQFRVIQHPCIVEVCLSVRSSEHDDLALVPADAIAVYCAIPIEIAPVDHTGPTTWLRAIGSAVFGNLFPVTEARNHLADRFPTIRININAFLDLARIEEPEVIQRPMIRIKAAEHYKALVLSVIHHGMAPSRGRCSPARRQFLPPDPARIACDAKRTFVRIAQDIISINAAEQDHAILVLVVSHRVRLPLLQLPYIVFVE